MKYKGKFYAAAAAGFMALSSFAAAPVFAADGDNQTEIDIVKYLDLGDPDLNAPQSEFTFNYSPVKVGENATTDGATKFNIYNGIEGGLIINGTANKPEKNGQIVTYGGATISAAPDGYDKPGIYRYTVFENEPNTAENKANEDITKSDVTYTVDVVVQYNDAGTVLEPAGILVYNEKSEKVSNLEFTNTLAAKVSANTLTVTKEIKGNQGVKQKEFAFTVTVNGAPGDQFKYSLNGGNTWENMDADAKSGVNTKEVKLSDGESVIVKGLSRSDTYSVYENREDYTQSVTSEGSVNVDDDENLGKTAHGDVGDGADAVIFTNTKNGAVPTGILMTAAPYAGLVGLGAVFAGVFFRRKRED